MFQKKNFFNYIYIINSINLVLVKGKSNKNKNRIYNNTDIDTDIISDSEIISDTQIISDSEIISDTQIISDNEIISDTQIISDSEIISDTDIISDSEIISDTQIISDSEIISDTQIISDSEIISDTEIIPDVTDGPIHENNNCIQNQCSKLDKNIINIGLTWDYDDKDIYDLDLSLEGLDKYNYLVGRVYFANTNSLNGSANLSRDSMNGNEFGEDETITINLDKIPNDVLTLVILINNFSNKTLLRTKNAYARIYELDSKNEIDSYCINNTKNGSFFLYGLIERKNENESWNFRRMYEIYEDRTRMYYTIFLNNFESKEVNHPISNEKLLTKGLIININDSIIYIGLGWENYARMVYDLDIFIITFDKYNNMINIINFNNSILFESCGFSFNDNKIGNGKEDDEILSVNYTLIDPNIFSFAIIVNNFKGYNLNGLKSAYIRLYFSDKLLGCYSFEKEINVNGILFGIFKKNDSNSSWIFEVINSPLIIDKTQDYIYQIKNMT